MKWFDALSKVFKSTMTNQEASGLISFARSVFAKYGHKQDVAMTPFDWYAYALPALGWQHEGDKFKVDTKHQLAPYIAPLQLWETLNNIAHELDAQSIPFDMVTDPRGTDAGYKQLAKDAWTAMQAERADPAPDTVPVPSDKVKEIPGTPGHGTAEDPWVITPTRTKAPTAAPPAASSGGGLGWLLLLLLLASRRGR